MIYLATGLADKMVDLENQLNAKLFELRRLEDENRTLLKVSHEQVCPTF